MTELTTLPTVPGTPFAGGFFVARYFLDGHEYLLIDAGQAGEVEGKWGEYGEDVAATHRTDGLANTKAMAEAGSELAAATFAGLQANDKAVQARLGAASLREMGELLGTVIAAQDAAAPKAVAA